MSPGLIGPWRGRAHLFLATAALLVMFTLAFTSAMRKSPTFDEQGYITRGLGYLRGQNRHMRIGHPLGLNALNAFLLVGDGSVRLPVDDPSWQLTSFHRPSELFLWEIGNNVERVMLLARLPTIWLGMLTAALAGRWARAITRNRWSGLAAIVLVAFDPNILAHTRLATTDLGLAAGALLAGYALWRFLEQPSWRAAILAGIAFGILQDTKFTAGLFVPLFAAVVIVALLPQKGTVATGARSRQATAASMTRAALLKLIIAFPASAFLMLWALYGFQVGTLPENLPTFSQLGGLTLPLSHHLEQLLDIGGRLQKSTPAFLLGQYSDVGWPTYFPVTFLLKTPLPILLLLLWAALSTVKNRGLRTAPGRLGGSRVDLAALLIPALGYFAIALTSEINLGYRHLLPVLPFLYVFTAAALTNEDGAYYRAALPALSHLRQPRLLRAPALVAIFLLWLVASTLVIHPHFLAFFNLFAGGPDHGWRSLVDSNLDWGQDIGGLKAWMDENGVEHVWLSYFGEARPEYYGIEYAGLDSYPPRLMNQEARPFYPHDPAPGIYAISATNLQGVLFMNHQLFDWFRERRPVAKIGYSIFVYDVAPRGESVDIILSGIQLDELDPSDYAVLGTNKVTPHWFDPAESMLMPQGKDLWWASGHQPGTSPFWMERAAAFFETVTESKDYTLSRSIKPLQPDDLLGARPETVASFSEDSGRITLTGVFSLTQTAEPGGAIQLTTTWKQEGQPQPVKIFVHAVDADRDIVTQWDGLGVAWEGWREKDLLIQDHRLPLTGDAPDGSYQVWIGVYHPESGRRWQAASGDRVQVGDVVVQSGD